MNNKTPTALDHLLDQVPVGQAPISDLLTAGHAAKRRQRRTLISGVAAATVLVIGGGTIASQALSDSNGQNNNPVADRSPGTVNDLKVRVESGVAQEVGVLADDMSSAELAFWDTDSQSVIYVSDYAYSSSCPPTASADVAEDGALTLNVRDYDYDGQEVCTADAGRVTVFIDGLTQAPPALSIDDSTETRTLPVVLTAESVPDGTIADRERTLAERIVRQELTEERQKDATIDSASFTVSDGTVNESNTGHVCDSGRLLRIRLIGEFPHIVTTGIYPLEGTETAQDTTVRAVLLTADYQTGKVCLVGVGTGEVAPAPGATVLALD